MVQSKTDVLSCPRTGAFQKEQCCYGWRGWTSSPVALALIPGTDAAAVDRSGAEDSRYLMGYWVMAALAVGGKCPPQSGRNLFQTEVKNVEEGENCASAEDGQNQEEVA